MSETNLKVMRCDRCGKKEDNSVLGNLYSWGRFVAQINNGANLGLGSDQSHKDLCPECLTALTKWWKQ